MCKRWESLCTLHCTKCTQSKGAELNLTTAESCIPGLMFWLTNVLHASQLS